MKRLFVLSMAVMISIGTMFAGPVDVNTAKSLGQMYVEANFDQRGNADLDLVHTVYSDLGEPCVYVFNVGSNGYVVVAAADNVHPILGYSKSHNFNGFDPQNGITFMLETYKNSISYALHSDLPATPEIAAEWKSLANTGKLRSVRGEKVDALVWTKWNQNSPYNLYAPQLPANAAPNHIQQAPGGRCYAGCVATAMGQLMKYWDYPVQGEGSHGYNCVGYGPTYYQYGYQYADFGATTYQWDLMPRTLSGASQEQIEAVALLLYHCGVAVDMTYDWDGSGSYSDLVPGSMASYFDYDYCVKRSRSSYSLANWISLLKDEFDLGRPVYYSGQGEGGGHAFVADGYDEDDFIHFNFGWSGSDDDFYYVDAIDYASQAAAIFNFVPSPVYQNTIQAPTNVTATKASDIAQEATITWTNPSKTLNNQTISSIDQMVVERDGKVIYTVDNPTPGASMSFVDNDVPCYSTFHYKVYAVKSGVKGAPGKASESFGPTCQWKIVATSENMAGWKSGCLIAYDAAGSEIDAFTMTSNNPVSYNMDVTIGKVSFAWKQGSENVALTFKIKDATGTIVYQYSGNSEDIPAGVLYSGNNGCGNAAPTEGPTNLYAINQGDNIRLTWTNPTKADYGYNIYRDGILFELAHSDDYVDENPGIGGHCYQVCALTDGGESPLSNEACGNAGEGCDSGSDLWFYLQTNNLKPVITWVAPENTETLSGYFVYRKVNADGEWERIKVVGANKTEYKETKSCEAGNWYYYRVIPYYQDIDCYAAPIKAKYGNEFYVKYYYDGVTDVNEEAAGTVTLYPNPAKDSFTIEAESLQNVMVYNAIGQLVYSSVCEGNSVVIDLSGMESGLYMVKVVTANGESIEKVSVIR